ncbi:hypothetical protein N7530_006746 [Penicillium desertorum]|uniref:Uncharacterized protein n=1 Tax=Penicillium desertorum TaxID=1303715 RepID=A0A9X0BMG4_9EURO|nr:hypothetical protein N7530_006746 [Penicillium desertorum]
MAVRDIQYLLVSLLEMTVLISSKVTHGIRKDYSKLDVGACGNMKNNKPLTTDLGWQLVYCFRSAFIVFIGIFIGISTFYICTFYIGTFYIEIVFIGICTFYIGIVFVGIVSIDHLSIIR